MENIEQQITENEAYTLAFIKRNNKITYADYQTLHNVNKDIAQRELKSLTNRSLINPRGIGREI